jgi:putative transcriptional regulator
MGVLHDVGILFDRLVLFLAEVSVKNKLRELRAAKEWSQSDLADKLGVSRQTVNAIETERYDPSLPLAFKVAQLFKLPIEEIFADDGK